jgi:drug/metabolite transporter (DMT)-like permease
MSPTRPSPNDWALFALCVGMWGSAYACVRIALHHGAEPWTIVAGRLWLGSLALHLLLWRRRADGKEPQQTPGATGKMIVLGLVGAMAPFALLSWAQTEIDSGLVAILAALTPLIVGVAAPLVGQEARLTSAKIVGLLLGFAGVIVLTGPDALAGLGGGDFLGQLAAAGGAVAYAINALLAQRGVTVPPMEAAARWTFWGALFSTPFAVMTWNGAPEPLAWVMISTLALGATGIASVAYFELLRSVGPSFVSQTNYILPLCAVALGAALFGERLDWNAALALVLIGLGLVTTQGAWRRFGFG